MPKRGGAKVSGCRSGLIAPQPAACRARQVGVGLIVGIVVLFAASPAAAYRPFDGTDAAVADFGEVEIEFQPIGPIRAGPTKPVSDAIFNFGFAERWELVLQGTAQALPEGVGPISVSNAAFLKYVVQPGVLQDKSGPEHCHGVRSSAARGRRWIGRRIWPDRNSVAAVGLGNGSFECRRRTSRPISMASFFSTPSSRDRTNGRSGRSLKSIRTASSPNRKRSPVWSGPYGR